MGKTKKMKMYIPETIKIEISEKKHAHCWDVITPNDEFSPMLVLNTYFEPRFLEMYQNKEISEDYLHNNGTGYVDAVGLNGIVERLQYYEYSILEENEISEKYKNEIIKKWECENISYTVKQSIKRKKEDE